MKGREIITALNEQRSDEHRFVKWWRKEDDFLDYDLVERFIENTGSGDEIGGIDLLTMDDMWNELRRIGGTRVKLVHNTFGDTITWTHKGKSGETTNTCFYTPENLMEIYDIETKGNPVD